MKLPVLQPTCTRSPADAGSLGTVAVVGNPNTGKTTLFNVLTGLRQHTGNYPGVTVDRQVGRMLLGPAGTVDLVDLPGTYSLSAHSPDELIVLDVLAGQGPGWVVGSARPDAVLIVADASNLERNLFLVSQVLETGLPAVLALTMVDVAERAGVRVDEVALGGELGCPVVPVVAPRGKGLDRLRAALAETLAHRPPARPPLPMPLPVEQAVADLASVLATKPGQLSRSVHRTELLGVLLDRDGPAEQRLVGWCGPLLADRLAELRRRLESAGVAIDLVEPQTRYQHIAQVVQRCVRRDGPRRRPAWPDRVDAVLLHPVGGVLVFVAVMAIMFQAIYGAAAPLMAGVDALFAWLGNAAAAVLPAGALQSLVRDGVIAGVGAVLVFLPQILILFALIAALEDCGYLARAAFVMDRLLSTCGLSGRSFVPMIACFACTVPGIMAARVIQSRRDRIATILVSPLMSCSARLPVYVMLISAFIPNRMLGGFVSLQGLTLLALYGIGVCVAIPLAWLFRRVLLGGRPGPLLMEMPPFHWPSARVIGVRLYDRGMNFVARAGSVVLLVTVAIWALTYFPHPARIAADYDTRRAEVRAQRVGADRDGELVRLDHAEAGEYLRQSLLGRAGRAIEPAVRPLGWDWRIGTAVLASFPARELIISTLGTIYNIGHDADSGDGRDGSVQLQQVLAAQRTATGEAALTPLVAIGLMVFVALCCQCAATLVVIQRETRQWRWPVLTFSYMTGLAYLATLAVVQIGRAIGFG